MAFPESLSREIRRRSHFQCCLCKALGVELHHIVPQSEGGADTEDNAAPLCPSCHETYGANPTKRKFLREARDLWYELCARRYAPDLSALTLVQSALETIASRQDVQALRTDFADMRSAFANSPRAISIPLSTPTPGARKKLDVRDLLILVHASAAPRPITQIEILCMRELWPVGKDDLRGVYKGFLRRFGDRTLRHLAARALHITNVVPADYLGEDDLIKAISAMRIEAACMNLADDGAVGAVLEDDGEITWLAAEWLN